MYIAQLPHAGYVGPKIHVYTGPQGVSLANFVEKFLPLTNEAHLLRVYDGTTVSRYTIPPKCTKFVRLLDTGAEGHLRSKHGGCVLDYTQCYALSPIGEKAYDAGSGEVSIISISLACAGSFHHGHDGASGSNCQKRKTHDSSWCSEFGKCLTTCGYQSIPTMHSEQCPAKGTCILYQKKYIVYLTVCMEVCIL